MLRINPLQPPRPFTAASSPASPRPNGWAGFVAAEDFDPTGIMTGVDLSESRYWWIPELYGPDLAPTTGGIDLESLPLPGPAAQATRRAGDDTATAA